MTTRILDRGYLEKGLFWGLLALSLLPTLLFEHFPSEDGALHVANASVYLNADSPLFSEYYQLEYFPVPNLLADLGLAGLLSFMAPPLATKVMVVVLAVGMALAIRWCLTLLGNDSLWLAVFAIPIAVGRFHHFAYLNFVMGLALSFAVFGYWLRFIRARRPPAWQWPMLAVLVFLVYLSHAFPFLILLLMFGAAGLDDAIEEARRGGGSLIGNLARGLMPVVGVSLVPLALVGVFSSGQGGMSYLHGPISRILRFPVYPIAVLSSYEVVIATLFALAVLILVVSALKAGRSSWRIDPGFLVATLFLLVAYMVVPDYIGDGADVPARIAVYAFVLTLFWLSSRPVAQWVRVGGTVAAVAVVIGLVAVRIPNHAVLDEEISEYMSGQVVVEPGSTVLPLWLTEIDQGRGPGGGRRLVRPLVEQVGDLTFNGDVVDLHHLPASLDLALFRFAPGRDIRDTAEESEPFPFVFGPGMVDIARYEAMGDGSVDYVWLWGRAELDPTLLESEQARSMLDQIDQGFELVFTSEPSGMLEVYRRRDA
ncbi:MAG: hypothetical protein WD269_02180 [Acidimicrobiia bacterium]